MISPKTLRAALGERRASYPVPFLAGTACGCALVILVISATLPDGSAAFWAFFGLACMLFIGASAMVAYALIRRPGLLRSERTTIMTRAIDILSDDEIDAKAAERIERLTDRYLDRPSARLEGPKTRKSSPMDDNADEDHRDE